MNTHPSPKRTRWLITGGCGFIGTSLIKNLISEDGHYIRVLDNFSVGTREDLSRVCNFTELNPKDLNSQNSDLNSKYSQPSAFRSDSGPSDTRHAPCAIHHAPIPVELLVGDIKDYDICLRAAQGIDVIVHLAASTGVGPSVEDPRKDMESNVIGTFNMLEAARNNGVQRFVFASSGAPVGECDPPIHEELAPHPVSPYGAGKLAGEGYCSSYCRTFGMETIALRFGNVYGPGSGRKNSVVAKFIKQAMQGETIDIYGDGKQTRDFIYIDDLINSIRLSATIEGIGGQVFQIATNCESTINELVEKLLSILKGVDYNDVKIRHGEPRLGDVKRNFSDTSKAKQLLGWKSNMNLEEGLKLTVEWFLDN